MPVRYEKLTNEPILIVTYTEPMLPAEDLTEVSQYTASLLDKMGGPLFRIDDLSQVSATFNRLVEGLSAAIKREPGSALDPRVRPALVGSGPLARLIANGVKQPRYGGVDAPRFNTMEEALAHARAEVFRTI